MWAMRTLALAFLVAVSLAGCGESTGGSGTVAVTTAESEFPAGTVTITTEDSEVSVDVEVATTPAEHEQGLMNRESLPDGAGMYFVFPGEQKDVSFWMKDTLIPLSIAVADADGRITKIVDMDPCEADPCPVYPVGSFTTALEVNQGAFADWGVEVGDRMELETP
jgi:hypothetical protein